MFRTKWLKKLPMQLTKSMPGSLSGDSPGGPGPDDEMLKQAEELRKRRKYCELVETLFSKQCKEFGGTECDKERLVVFTQCMISKP